MKIERRDHKAHGVPASSVPGGTVVRFEDDHELYMLTKPVTSRPSHPCWMRQAAVRLRDGQSMGYIEDGRLVFVVDNAKLVVGEPAAPSRCCEPIVVVAEMREVFWGGRPLTTRYCIDGNLVSATEYAEFIAAHKA